ncbi:uncharacterized protein isoform X2 [Rhodnius prolixus]|uniref:uncharacterized protein isoform X2 n=1 Tax=Rhodnius prolixus TaxID=13249 RepID=UPI003D18C04B
MFNKTIQNIFKVKCLRMSNSRGAGSDKRSTDFNDLLKNTKKFLEERAEEVKKTISFSDIPKREALTKMMEEHNKRVIQSLKETSKQIEEEFKSNPDLQSFVQNLKTKFNEEAEKLKAAKSDDISKSLESNWASLTKLMEQSYEEFMKKSGNNKELQKHFETLLKKLKETAQELEEGNASDFRELLNNTKQFLLQYAKELKRALDISDKKKKDELTKIFVEQNEKLIRSLVETSKKIEEQVGDTFMRKCTLKVCMYANESAECIASLEEIFGL